MPRLSLVALLIAGFAIAPAHAVDAVHDLVIRGGRVMDPETHLDAVREIGISDGKIAAISEKALAGKETIDATGLVVAPGFIDLHQHGWDTDSIRFKVRDGVTSILELEVGTGDVDRWYREFEGKLPIHFGVSVGHIPVRMEVMGDAPSFLPKADGKAATETASAGQIARMKDGIARGLDQGAVAVGFGIRYTPAASRWEILEMFRAASRVGASCHVHLRERGDHSVAAAQEVIACSAVSGAPLHIVHLQSSGGSSSPKLLRMVSEAQARNIDITAEVYPWTAGMTEIESAIFEDGWRENFGLDYGDLQWGATGERLTEETFQKFRKTGGLVIVHINPESVVTQAVAHPASMVASDGLTGHPRNAGTSARVLGHYVREHREITLMEALRKLALMPAQRLEGRVPAMKRKGRVQEGCDADLTLFDPESVAARATYTDPNQASAGIPFVLVDGVPVVRDGRIVDGALPGQPIRAAQIARE